MSDIPSGWRAVPVEPTPKMHSAGLKVWRETGHRSDSRQGDEIYRAMLAAAPSPPSAEPLQPGDEMVWRNPAPHAAPPSVPSGRYREGSVGPQQPSPPPSGQSGLAKFVHASAAERETLAADLPRQASERQAASIAAPPSDALREAAIKSLSESAAAYRDYFRELHWLQSSLEKQERISAIAHGATAKLEEAVALLAAPSAGSAGQAVDQQARRLALEEAATLCENAPMEDPPYVPGKGYARLAKAIRALAHPETPDKEAEK